MINLGGCVRVVYGTGEKKEIAWVQGQTEEPVYLLVDTSGHQYAWIRSLVQPCTPDEEIDYWRRRAFIAEAAKDAAVNAVNDSAADSPTALALEGRP